MFVALICFYLTFIHTGILTESRRFIFKRDLFETDNMINNNKGLIYKNKSWLDVIFRLDSEDSCLMQKDCELLTPAKLDDCASNTSQVLFTLWIWCWEEAAAVENYVQELKQKTAICIFFEESPDSLKKMQMVDLHT